MTFNFILGFTRGVHSLSSLASIWCGILCGFMDTTASKLDLLGYLPDILQFGLETGWSNMFLDEVLDACLLVFYIRHLFGLG